MIAIKLPRYAKLIPKLDGTVYDTVAIRQEFDQYRQNVQEVLFSTAMIEDALKGIISVYFVSESKRGLFENIVVNTSSFQFNDARRIALKVLEAKGVDETKRKELEEHLQKVMGYRNALIHGSAAKEHDKFMLRWFSGKPMEREINDDFWDEVSKRFWACHELLHSLIPTVKISE